jgi:hypothetical protein
VLRIAHFGDLAAACIDGQAGGAQVVRQAVIQRAAHAQGAALVVLGDHTVCNLVVRAYVDGGDGAVEDGLDHLAPSLHSGQALPSYTKLPFVYKWRGRVKKKNPAGRWDHRRADRETLP